LRPVVVVALALFAAACNNPSYNRSTVQRDLERDTGLSASQAECVTERLEATIGVRRLGARDEPTPLERDKTHAAVVYAILACSGSPFDSGSVAQALTAKAEVPAAEAECLVREVPKRIPEDELASATANVNAVRGAVFDATLECGGSLDDARRSIGLTREEAKCVGQRQPVEARTVEVCTSPTTTTTTTSPPPSTPTS
jgi:hypothetical protein